MSNQTAKEIIAIIDKVESVDDLQQLSEYENHKYVTVQHAYKKRMEELSEKIEPAEEAAPEVEEPVEEVSVEEAAHEVEEPVEEVSAEEAAPEVEAKELIIYAYGKVDIPADFTVVYPFFAQGAQGKELMYSLRSLEKHLKGNFNVVIIGDIPDYVDRNVVDCIPMERASTNPQEDVFAKREAILESELVCEKILWMNDDIYLVNDVTIDDFEVPWAVGPLVRRRDPLRTYQVNKTKTYDALYKIKRAKWNYSNHAPNIYHKERIAKLHEKFKMSDLVCFNDFYFNYFFSKVKPLITQGRDENKVGVYKQNPSWAMFDKLVPKTKVLGNGVSGWQKHLIKYLKNKFYSKSLFER